MEVCWITKGILNSIVKKNQIYRKCIRTKNATKIQNCTSCLSHRNSLNKITKLSIVNNYKTFFEDSKNKLNKVLQGIKENINSNKKAPNNLGTSTIMERLKLKKGQ